MKTQATLPRVLAAAAAVAGAACWLAARRRHWPGFEGRVALIIGGTRGLGLALARRFAAAGAQVAICGRDARGMKRALRDLESRGAAPFGRVCDARDGRRVADLVREVERRYGRIDVLVNNAGVISVGPLDSMTLEDYEDAMDTHYWGPLQATLAVLPGMRGRGEGRIVNIASIGGKVSMPHLIPYSASKFALVGLSEGLRAELRREGVCVTTVCPWLTRTGSPRHAWFKGRHGAEHAWFTLADSLPGASMNAASAARRIVEGCRKGKAELVLSAKGRLAAAFQGAFPGASAGLTAMVNRALPSPGGIGADRRPGRRSESAATRSVLTGLGRRAERAYLQR